MNEEIKRLMPDQYNLGRYCQTTIGMPMKRYEDWLKDPETKNPTGARTVMGYALPKWQRGLVWSDKQKISLIESLWRGIPIGTFTFNRMYGSPLDNLLIDGQQRLHAIECYLKDEFKVFGYLYSETTVIDKRRWDMNVMFPCYITETKDEEYLKNYYNLMNFGGISHTEDQRAK